MRYQVGTCTGTVLSACGKFKSAAVNYSTSIKGTISRDWGELLMVEIDQTHLFNVAADGLFFILSAFSSGKVLKNWPAGRSFYH